MTLDPTPQGINIASDEIAGNEKYHDGGSAIGNPD